MTNTISDKVLALCTKTSSVSQALQADPTKPPSQAAKELFKNHKNALSNDQSSQCSKSSEESAVFPRKAASDDSLQRAKQCGNFGDCEPSELFLRMFHDGLLALEHDPLAGVVSPSLMGSTGTMPYTVVGVVWDTARHMGNLIARAEKEVFFATNYWMLCDASKFITEAIKELSRKAGERKQKIVFKVMYDRGNLKQVIKNHQPVSVKEYTSEKIGIPSPEEIPNIDLRIVNYHQPALGTFHAKYVIVDRKYGLICSNNIQKNDNLEMMTHVEGPIVDSLYDTCLQSWHEALDPQLPCISTPNSEPSVTFSDPEFLSLFKDGTPPSPGIAKPASETGEKLKGSSPSDPQYDTSIAGEFCRMRDSLSPTDSESHLQLVNKHLNDSTDPGLSVTASEPKSPSDYFNPYIPHPPHSPFPMALVNRKPYGLPNNSNVLVPQNLVWLAGVRNAKRRVFIQSPNINAKPLLSEILNAVRRGVEVEMWMCLGYNDAGELLPGQGGLNDQTAKYLRDELKSDPEEVQTRLKIGWYVAKDQNRVVHKKERGRSCHIKLMIVDDQVGVQGNGNQDAQSWYHSMEVNIMIDSELICRAWQDGILRNQNTHLFGMGSPEDGLWRGKDGKPAKFAIGPNPGRFSWLTGAYGAVQRVRGVGGF